MVLLVLSHCYASLLGIIKAIALRAALVLSALWV